MTPPSLATVVGIVLLGLVACAAAAIAVAHLVTFHRQKARAQRLHFNKRRSGRRAPSDRILERLAGLDARYRRETEKGARAYLRATGGP